MLQIELINGAEGPSLCLAEGTAHGYRIAGRKAWGGGKITKSWPLDRRALEEMKRMIDAELASSG